MGTQAFYRRFQPDVINAVPRLTEWGILGVARQLYTLNTGAVASRLLAGSYCRPTLPNEYKAVMTAAMETRRLNKTELKPPLKRAMETLACMKWIIAKFNEAYRKR